MAVVTHGKGSKWTGGGKLKSEAAPNPSYDNKKPESPDNQRYVMIEYRDFASFRLYNSPSAWMTLPIFTIEMKRLSKFLDDNYPGRKYVLFLDNARYFFFGFSNPNLFSVHKLKLMLKNIVFCFFLPATTGWYQPCDSLILAQLKSKIRGFIDEQVYINDHTRIKEEVLAKKSVDIFLSMKKGIFTLSWQKTHLVLPEELEAIDFDEENIPTDQELLLAQVEKDEDEDEINMQMNALQIQENPQQDEQKKPNKEPKKNNYKQASIKSFFMKK